MAAYFWEFEKRGDVNSDLERVVEERHGWEMHVVRRYKLDSAHHSHHHQRQMRNIMQLHKIDKDTIVITTEPKVDKKTGRKSSRNR